jgi:hypothetical protein
MPVPIPLPGGVTLESCQMVIDPGTRQMIVAARISTGGTVRNVSVDVKARLELPLKAGLSVRGVVQSPEHRVRLFEANLQTSRAGIRGNVRSAVRGPVKVRVSFAAPFSGGMASRIKTRFGQFRDTVERLLAGLTSPRVSSRILP